MFDTIKKLYFSLACTLIIISCGTGVKSGDDATDSVNTDTIPDPSYNPVVETDSGAKQMNLDSTNLKDSVQAEAP